MRRGVALLVGGSLALGCGGDGKRPSSQVAASPARPPPRAAASAPEVRRERTIEALGGAFRARLHALEAPRVEDGPRAATLRLPLSGGAWATCSLEAGDHPLADGARRRIAAEVPRATQPLELRVGVAGGQALLFARADRVSVLATSGHGAWTLVCEHRELDAGRELGFFRAVEEIVASAVKAPPAGPRFGEVGLLSQERRPIGFYERAREPRGAPDRVLERRRMAILGGDESGWSSLDGGQEAELTGDRLTELRISTVRDGVTVLDARLTVRPDGEHAWTTRRPSGEARGTFRPPQPLVTELSRAPAMLRMLAEGSARFWIWDPEFAEDQATEVVIRHDGGRIANFGARRSSHDCELDRWGICARESSKEWDASRLWVDGGL